jgi:uncharacterized protein YhaN
MKLLQLRLIAFGPFTGATLDLSAGSHGLHLIYGCNEAGKSSALRALRQLFYGIDERSPDNFVHAHPSLRIGALISRSDGARLEFVRRKARTNSLRGPDDTDVLDAHALDRFLGGVDAATFHALFGIDHETLVCGGRDVVKGAGQVGELIFETGLGIVRLRDVREGLQAECDDLFKPGGKKQKITETIHAYHAARAGLKNAQLLASDWQKHDDALAAARETRDRLEREWHDKSREHNRLTRIRNALPLIGQRKQLVADLDPYRDAVLLSDDFGTNLNELVSSRRVADQQACAARAALERLDRQIDQLVVSQALLDQAETVEELHRRLGEYQKDMKDRPERSLQQRQVEHEAKEILNSLGRAAELGEAEAVRLRRDEPKWIQDLGNQHQGLIANCSNARQTAHDRKERIEKARQDLTTLHELRDPAELRRVMRQAQAQGPLELECAQAVEALAQAEKQAGVALARLPHWHGTLEALEALAVPTAETIDRFEEEFNDLKARLTTLEDRLDAERAAADELEAEVRKLELQQEVPTEEDLHSARGHREAGWQLVRRAWLDGQTDAGAVAAYVEHFPQTHGLAEAYARSVEQADQLSDRLRREADRVARKVELVANRQRLVQQIDRCVWEREDIKPQLAELEEEWAALWAPLGVRLVSPKEMRGWLRLQADLVRQAQDIRVQRDRARLLRENTDGLRARLAGCLQGFGEPCGEAGDTLAQLLDRSQVVVDRFDDTSRKRAQLQQECAAWELELRQAEARVRHGDEELVQWQLQWARAMQRIGLPGDALPSAANTFLAAIADLFQKLREADGFRRRIEGIDRDAREFTAAVQALTRLVAPELAELAVDQAVRQINDLLNRARGAQKEKQTLEKQRSQEQKNLRTAEDALAAAERRLADLCREARCAAFEELPHAAQRSARRRQLEKEIQQRDEQILAFSAGATLESLIAEAEQLDPDALKPAIDRLAEATSALREQIKKLDQTIGSEQNELDKMNGNAVAAEAAEEAENLLASLRSDVQEYAALRLASVVLQQGIERFREKNQGTILEHASRIFSRLTAGSFAGLRIDSDDSGEPVLVGIRPGSRQIVRVAGMSDGSCDQLYLALRLAALESWLDSHEPIPFIVDDILLSFDNERAVAALEALAELSKRTQVIFFSHHQHLVELAEKHLKPEILFTHDLSFASTATHSASVEPDGLFAAASAAKKTIA